MESSEDDAGAATNASRRESAREKDFGGSEECSAGGDMLQEGGAASETASMSEETFDADSVPSPSQELNTSTEAILDMIDEIVDGPSAPKRRSRASADTDADDPNVAPDAPATPDPLPPTIYDTPTAEPQPSNPSTSAESENISNELVIVQPTESTSPLVVKDVLCPGEIVQESEIQAQCSSELHTDDLRPVELSQDLNTIQSECILNKVVDECDESIKIKEEEHVVESLPQKLVPDEGNSENVCNSAALQDNTPESATETVAENRELDRHIESPQASSSVATTETAESTSGERLVSEQSKPLSNSLLHVPSSSVIETVESISDSSENQSSERTVKCVTSSDKRENVTIESAESTSSEGSVSEGRNEASTRSPLRRRLVRPAPSERRPDSTVSSTVDSQTVNIHTTQQTTSESVTKDVSSSSDAIASVYDNVKPEEIRNLSEISVCKAETSMNPPKKIKLVRQKVTASFAQKDFIPEKPVVASESEQCQSTSTECTPSPMVDTVSTNEIQKCSEPSADLSNPSVSEEVASHSQAETTVEKSEKLREDTPKDSQCSLPPITEPEVSEPCKGDQKRVPPIKLNLNIPIESPATEEQSDRQENVTESSSVDVQENIDSKQVPKLTIKLASKQSEEIKSPIPKLTIKPIRPPSENEGESKESKEQIPSITKINIKPIPKPAEKINDIHRKSSSSEVSESESSENDESNSTSDQASNSDQCPSDVVPKVTIKVGKPGTESEGKFYTEQNVPKLLIKGIHDNEEQESVSKLMIISQAEEKQSEKVPKLTIKTVQKSEGQPLSPKLTIKPVKPPEPKSEGLPESGEQQQIPKLKISAENFSLNAEIKENSHIPKITIKPVVKIDSEPSSKTPKKSTVVCDSSEHIPVVTKLNIKPIQKPSDLEMTDSLEVRVPVVSKLNIKPIIKPNDSGESSEELESQVPVISKLNIKPVLRPVESDEGSLSAEGSVPVVARLNIKPIVKPPETGETSECIEEKVPVVSKINIKPLIKPKDNEIESSLDDIPKVTKLNIKPLKNPEEKSSEEKDCDDLNTDTEENSIPVVTKLNIKPIVKPVDEDTSKDSENQSSETGNSSDENTDHIPVVTKINIKPILKPNDCEDSGKREIPCAEIIPVVTKLNIKPLVKPEECKSPSSSSPKRESLRITKLNIKPVLKPEEIDVSKIKNENEDTASKNPPLVMKINIKSATDGISSDDDNKNVNNIDDKSHPVNNLDENVPKVSKLIIKPIVKPHDEDAPGISTEKTLPLQNCKPKAPLQAEIGQVNCVSNLNIEIKQSNEIKDMSIKPQKHSPSSLATSDNALLSGSDKAEKVINTEVGIPSKTGMPTNQNINKPQPSLQNCTLLKKLLETKKDGLDKRLESESRINHLQSAQAERFNQTLSSQHHSTSSILKVETPETKSFNEPNHEQVLDLTIDRHVSKGDICRDSSETITKPLEISISDKISNQSSGQDSPRIILKINKTDHGPSAKIITEEIKRPETPQNDLSDNTQDVVNDRQNQKKVVNSRKKQVTDTPNVPMGKRLRSSRIVENTEISPVKRNTGKRPSATETSPVQSKEPELSMLESKRLKLGQLLSGKTMSNSSVASKVGQVSPTKLNVETKQTGKIVNHSLLNNENCSKNGNSKLHNILSNLQAKQAQALAFNDIKGSEKISITPELESNASTGSSDVVEVIPAENSRLEVQQMLINENSESHDFAAASDMSQDPLDTEARAEPGPPAAPAPPEPSAPPPPAGPAAPTPAVPCTPQPKKRGRPRKLPASEPAKPVVLPTPALEERPQRSLRLSRDQSRQPAILAKPRGRGRGRGARRAEPGPREEPVVEVAGKFLEERPPDDIDPTSSRIKLPRMTEALDKMPGACATPLSSRRHSAGLFDAEPKVVLDMLPKPEELKSPETPRGGRGSRGGRGRGRTPRAARGRGRGGGRGAMYMKETMGIYGRVCGPATTTVQLFEEETCMMDDNATPAKPSHLLDEDSQSSVKSSTNDSSRQKSKFAELFDSNKIWTAADVKEYMWPLEEAPDVERQVMMIQEQVAMFLGVKSFKRRYPELKRRTIAAAERDYVLAQGLVTEPLCDLGITAVDASEVLDIMLSDYPHKYEEYRAHQRQRQLAEPEPEPEPKPEPRPDRIEMKIEAKPAEAKPEPPKVDLEKSRQEAMAAASEWNARLNALRAPACVDTQSGAVHRRRPPRAAPPPRVRPPAGFYPHALLPGQYQHHYRRYTSDQLRYFPLNTVTAAPPAPPSPAPSDSDSEPDWSSSSSGGSVSDRPQAKRKKLTKTKRSSQNEPGTSKEKEKEDKSGGAGASGTEDTCRACGLRLEANRKYTHERFLVCATCNCKLHPGCVELSADTIRAARAYAWQCAECKVCGVCARPAPPSPPAPPARLRCSLCDRAFHAHCAGLQAPPAGRWHCAECAVCKSCGAREPAGRGAAAGAPAALAGAPPPAAEEAQWHHQTRRGPGGHKIYSHSLCTPCARAYRIGRYCPLCERSFIGPKGTMQLVICKLCDRQHHQECVRQRGGGAPSVLDYTCGWCRRGGITSRAAAARLAPRTIATLFMAKRRFNKYAHRQYMKSRQARADAADDSCEPPPPPGDASEGSEGAEREPEPVDPLAGAGDEAAAAVAALQSDYGD